ncbi:MAG: DUF5063 domain-containing protein [Planctomycetota bacterium]
MPIDAFAAVAQRYCEFIDQWIADTAPHPYTTLLQTLSELSITALQLPLTNPDRVHDKLDAYNTTKPWKEISTEIERLTFPAVMDLVERHPEQDPGTHAAIMLFDDLSDVYLELKSGLYAYHSTLEDATEVACWHWRFNYEIHWGEHLYRALLTVHEIRYQLRLD